MYKITQKALGGVPIGANYAEVISERNGTVTVAFYMDEEKLMELGGSHNRQVMMDEDFKAMVDPRRADQDSRKDVPIGRNLPETEKAFIDMLSGDIVDDANQTEHEVNVKKQAKLPVGHVTGSQVRSGSEVKTKIHEGRGDTYKKDDIVKAMLATDIRDPDIRSVLVQLSGQEVSRKTSAIDVEEAFIFEADDDEEIPDQRLGANPENFNGEDESPSVKMDSIKVGMQWDRFRELTKPVPVKQIINNIERGTVFREVKTKGLRLVSIEQKSIRKATYVKSQESLTLKFDDNTETTFQNIGDGQIFVSDDHHFYYNT